MLLFNKKFFIFITISLFLTLLLQTIALPDIFDSIYVGSEKCAECHLDTYNNFIKSGHNNILHKNPDFSYPYSSVKNVPNGYTWDSISYVIGGYGWKAVYVDRKGYIITGYNTQYNLETNEFVPYFPNEKNKKYTCGKCHSTGYSINKDIYSLPGVEGTWIEKNITCERCHGPRNKHIENTSIKYNTLKSPNTLCFECHTNTEKECSAESAEPGKHEKQYDELINSPHSEHNCTTCHDAHISSKYSPEKAIKIKCKNCHPDKIINFSMNFIVCQDCHMPYVLKSAIEKGKYEKDMRSHKFSINCDSTVTDLKDNSLTLDYVCLRCHKDKTIGWASKFAEKIHLNPTYTGSDKCAICHNEIFNNFAKSGHNHISKKSNEKQLSIPKPPDGYIWDEISDIVGGYKTKANFVDLKGFIITGKKAQYNLLTKQFDPYFPEEKNKSYTCGKCHTTGYNLKGSQEGMRGISGTWVESGITCERCHGKGSNHIAYPFKNKLIIDKSINFCKECHSYCDDETKNTLPDEEPEHLKKNKELISGRHKEYDCVTCHDPHISTKYSYDKAIKDCAFCHKNKMNFGKDKLLKCKNCHTYPADKLIIEKSRSTNKIKQLHIFKIDTDTTIPKDNEDEDKNQNINLYLACIICHTNKTLGWASYNAKLIH